MSKEKREKEVLARKEAVKTHLGPEETEETVRASKERE